MTYKEKRIQVEKTLKQKNLSDVKRIELEQWLHFARSERLYNSNKPIYSKPKGPAVRS